MKIITISGLDGSGKTLQLNFLGDHLSDKGKKVFMYHAIKFSLATKISNLLKSKKRKKSTKAKTTSGKFAIFLRKIFLLIDILNFKLLCKKLKKQKFDYVLSDRYFYDQIVNIHFLEKKHKLEENSWWFKLAKKQIMKPSKAVFLEVSPLTILDRERKIEQGMEYLKEKFQLYEQLISSESTKHFVINGEQSKNDVHKDVKKLLDL